MLFTDLNPDNKLLELHLGQVITISSSFVKGSEFVLHNISIASSKSVDFIINLIPPIKLVFYHLISYLISDITISRLSFQQAIVKDFPFM